MKHRKKIRRWAILALVLVLLLNTMGVQAGTGESTVTVSDYGSFYTDNEAKISIKASKEPESEDPAVTTLSTSVIAPEQAESPQESPNWVEVVTMLLLAVLVLGELRDKWKSR